MLEQAVRAQAWPHQHTVGGMEKLLSSAGPCEGCIPSVGAQDSWPWHLGGAFHKAVLARRGPVL